MIRFVFNERRAAQAAAHLIQLNGKPINYMVLIKLLYFADRKSLISTGRPITGDRMMSMKNGPVLSAILDLIHVGKRRASAWFEYISEPTDYDVDLIKQEPDRNELSTYELKVLDEVFREYGNLPKWDLVDLTHDLPEWRDPASSVIAIDPRSILRTAGKSKEEISRISKEAAELLEISALLDADELECVTS